MVEGHENMLGIDEPLITLHTIDDMQTIINEIVSIWFVFDFVKWFLAKIITFETGNDIFGVG